jgi:hypothetical protein
MTVMMIPSPAMRAISDTAFYPLTRGERWIPPAPVAGIPRETAITELE